MLQSPSHDPLPNLSGLSPVLRTDRALLTDEEWQALLWPQVPHPLPGDDASLAMAPQGEPS